MEGALVIWEPGEPWGVRGLWDPSYGALFRIPYWMGAGSVQVAITATTKEGSSIGMPSFRDCYCRGIDPKTEKQQNTPCSSQAEQKPCMRNITPNIAEYI